MRRDIIRMIGERGFARYKDLSAISKEPGTLYFHIKWMMTEPPLIFQDDNRNYFLTDIGKIAYNLLNTTSDYLPKLDRKYSDISHRLVYTLGLGNLARYYTEHAKYFIVESLVLVSLLGYLFSLNRKVLILTLLEPINMGSVATILSSLSSWIVISLICEFLSIKFFSSPKGISKVFVAVSISYIPFFLPSLVTMIFPYYDINRVLSSIIFLISEVWFLIILTVQISITKGIRYLRSLFIAIAVGYLSLFLHLLIS
ncbi:MAG: hypothetical protein ACTSR0_05285 [Candidatus Asgardarchaeia archaeon]